MVNGVNAQKGFQPQLIILIAIVWLKNNVVVSQEDGATSLTVVEDNPLEEVLDITNLAEEQGQIEFIRVLQQNMRMSQEVESIGCFLHAFRARDLEVFRRTQESVELVPAQDVEMDCFGFVESQ